MKVLLIDDDLFLRDMYAVKFVESGHKVESFEQAMLAVQRLQEGESFDVILVDMIMPVTTGLDFLNKISDDNLVGDAVVIMLSNQSQQADINEALEAGAHAYIVKAENIPSEVVEKVETIHSQHRQKKSDKAKEDDVK